MKKPDTYIFLPSGCIREEAMLEYIRGGFPEEVRARIREHMDHCPLCREAFEGLSAAKDISEQQRYISRVRNRVSGNVRIRAAFYGSGKKYRMYSMMAAAASIIILVGVISVIRLVQHRPLQSLARHEEMITVEEERVEPPVITPDKKQAAERTETVTEPKEEKSTSRIVTRETTTPVKEMTDAEAVNVEANQPEISRSEDETETDKTQTAVTGASEDLSASEPAEQMFAVPETAKGVNEALGKGKAAPVATAAKKATVSYKVTGVAQVPAQFVSKGYPDFAAYISDSLRVPDTITNGTRSWNVRVTFTVDTTGTVTGARVLQSDNSLLNTEALRVIRHSPRWIPATLSGRPVPEEHVVTVTFPPVRKDE